MKKITETTALEFKLKEVSFQGSHLIDADGEVIELIEEMKKIFKGDSFEITVSSKNKTEFPIEAFENK